MSDKPISTIAALRVDLVMTQEAFGSALGLKSKGHVSEIERSNRCSPEIALAIEALSDNRLDAALLSPVIEAARKKVA